VLDVPKLGRVGVSDISLVLYAKNFAGDVFPFCKSMDFLITYSCAGRHAMACRAMFPSLTPVFRWCLLLSFTYLRART
jgi:hypothetical protein